VVLPQGDMMRTAKVNGRSLEPDYQSVGTYHDKPLINTLAYEVEFPDSEVREYSANVIFENLLSQVDSKGYTMSVFDGILDYRKEESFAPKSDLYMTTRTGTKRMRKTTSGWSLLVLWKDGSETWVPLKELKESHPIETAEFATSLGIDGEPAFAWWFPQTFKKRDVIILVLQKRIKKLSHKYGVELPSTVEEALALDKKNGNDLWKTTISKANHDKNDISIDIKTILVACPLS